MLSCKGRGCLEAAGILALRACRSVEGALRHPAMLVGRSNPFPISVAVDIPVMMLGLNFLSFSIIGL